MIIESMQTGEFCNGKHYPSTSAGFGRILQNIKNPVIIRELITELQNIIEHDPYMFRSEKDRLLSYHKHEKFLYECFLYTLRNKGNAAKRPKQKDARRTQDQAIKKSANVSKAAQSLYDVEDNILSDNSDTDN